MNGQWQAPEVDWTPLEPRQGVLGAWDRFVGPGATAVEQWLAFAAALAGGVAVAIYASGSATNWSQAQSLLAIVLAFDLAGGVVTNATASAKRWYHRPGQGPRQLLGFTAVHALHLFLVAWLFLNSDWGYFLGTFGLLMTAAAVIAVVPLNLRRPVALAIYVLALVMALAVFPSPAGLEWFLPVFYLKLLVSHLLPEAPFTATDKSSTNG